LGELKTELSLIVRDSSLEDYFERWLNEAVEDIAFEFDLPALKRLEPYLFSVNTGAWLYDLPSIYHKKVFKVLDSDYYPVTILRSMVELDALDEDHDDEDDKVRTVAVENGKIGVYPKADDTLGLWFFEKPEVMSLDADVPSCLPFGYHAKVLIPKVVIKNFKLIQDLMTEAPHVSLSWWMEEYRNGLYGSARGDKGMINLMVRDRKPKRRAGRNSLP
jgi:hypothetical protein